MFGWLNNVFNRSPDPWGGRPLPVNQEKLKQGVRIPAFLPYFDTLQTADETQEMRIAYRRMLADPNVKAAFLGKIISVMSLELVVRPPKQYRKVPRYQQVSEFVEWCLTDGLKGGLPDLVWSVLSGALIDGYSICERVWHLEQKGRWRGKRVLRQLKPKDVFQDLVPEMDEFRNYIAIRGLRYNAGEYFDVNDFVIHSHLGLYGNPTGMSDFRAVYSRYWMLDSVLKIRAMGAEKKAYPVVSGEYPDVTRQAKLEEALSKIRYQNWLAIPAGVKMQVLDTAGGAADILANFCRDLREEIALGIQGAVLSSMTGGQGQMRGDSTVHKDTSDLFKWHLSAAIKHVLNDRETGLIPDLCDRNFAGLEEYPTGALSGIDEAELKESLEIDKGLQSLGLKLDAEEIEERYGRKHQTDPKKALEPAQPGGGLPGAGGAPGGPPGGLPEPPGGGSTPPQKPASGPDGGGDDPQPEDGQDTPDSRAEAMADILGGLYGDEAAKHLGTDDHGAVDKFAEGSGFSGEITDKLGRRRRYVDGKPVRGQEETPSTPETRQRAAQERQKAVAGAHDGIKAVLGGDRSPETAQKLVAHLATLTTRHLHDLKKQYQLSASGRLKEHLVAKLADRLSRGRVEGKPAESKPAEQPAAKPAESTAPAPPAEKKPEAVPAPSVAQNTKEKPDSIDDAHPAEPVTQEGGARQPPEKPPEAPPGEGPDETVRGKEDEKAPETTQPQAPQGPDGAQQEPKPPTAQEKPANPFRDEAAKLRAKADRLSGGTAHDQAMAQAFPFGTGRPGNASSRRTSKQASRRIESSIDRAKEAVEIYKKANALDAQAGKFDAGDIDAHGRPTEKVRQAEADKTQKFANLNESIAGYMRSILKPGDTVYVNGNPVSIKRVNPTGVTTESGSRWSYDDLLPHGENGPMSMKDLVGAAKEWAAKHARLPSGSKATTFAEGRWITIGGKTGEDGTRHGGAPVYVEGGRITKGHPNLTGKKLGALDQKAEGVGARKANTMERDYSRAAWGKKAKAEGVEPEHLHSLAKDIVDQDREYAGDYKRLVDEAHDALAEFGGTSRTLTMNAGRRGPEEGAGVRGMDEVSQHLAKKYPHLFKEENGENGLHQDQLFNLLRDGAPEPISEEDAYEQALSHLIEQKRREPKHDDNNAVPFSEGDPAAAIDAAAADAHPSPTEAQREAGNYRKGHVALHGLPITIETAAGSTRSGTDADGAPWSIDLANNYGYIKRTESEADGDHVDVFLGPLPEIKTVFVVDQMKPDGSFDEAKCMLGFPSADAAKAAYHANYAPDWKGFGGITRLSMQAFKDWLQSGATDKPLSG